jgi:hypothetical protein
MRTSFHRDYVIPQTHTNAVVDGATNVIGNVGFSDVDDVILQRAVLVDLACVSVNVAPMREVSVSHEWMFKVNNN